ncbi:MAG TPA: SIR2 family protein [Pyrinomonadaceae bacterium]|nr:SIR2 family protein [Pyrinomonadaceae bacterium]
MNHYHINIFHSEKYNGYIAHIPDLPQCLALGGTAAEALSEVEKARDILLQKAAKLGDTLPAPQYQPEIYVGKDLTIPEAPQPPPMDQASYDEVLEYIAKRVAKHEFILFLGSAIHVPPDGLSSYHYPAEKAPPIGANLSKRLAEKSEYPGQDWWNLQRVTQHFESTKGRFRLVEEIEAAVHTGREPSPMLKLLADLEFPLVITTNYDQLYERALEETGLPKDGFDTSIYSKTTVDEQMKRIVTVDCANKPDPKRPFILKIHGDVSKSQSIVITDEDYIQFVLRMSDPQPYHPFGQNVLANLMRWPTLFIGYSLVDYNLRLLFQTLRWKKDASQIPPTYSVDKKPDQLILDVWEKQRRYVHFLVLNLWDFIPRLHALVKGSQPPPPPPPENGGPQ